MRYLLVAAATVTMLAASFGGWAAGGQIASAQGPTPVPDLDVQMDGNRVSWTPLGGAAEYRLTGTLLAIRVNASDPCLPSLAEDRRTITIDERLGADATEFEAPLPPLPPEDRWLVASVNITLRAFDAQGREIAAQAATSVEESACPPAATATPQPTVSSLPRTGAGQTRGGGSSVALVFTVAGTGLLALAWVRSRQAT